MLVFPNAKINIGLNIVEKRGDGFHSIESVFYPIPFCDMLEVVAGKTKHPFFTQTGHKLDCPLEKNLVVKAFLMLEKELNVPGISIHLHKLVPSGAGLGGGSSDCAYLISALNRLFSLNLGEEQMIQYASRLGSDCAFFIRNTPAYVTGRGEVIEPMALSLKGMTMVLVKPDVHVSTAEAYSLVKPAKPGSSLKENIQKPVSEWRDCIVNDFEKPLFAKVPVLSEIKEKLYSLGALYASMTGSGSAVYGFFSEPISLKTTFSPHFVWEGNL